LSVEGCSVPQHSKYQLATSPWPRTGRDVRNSALAPFQGARTGDVLWSLDVGRGGSVTVAEDGTFRFSGDGSEGAVLAVDSKRVLWTQTVGEWCSAPLLLAGGYTVVSARDSVCVFDAHGELIRCATTEEPLDDSEASPNVHPLGDLLLGGVTGEILGILYDSPPRIILSAGYDALPPSVYEDGTLCVAAYYGGGPSRWTLRGERLWNRDALQADCLVCLNRDSEAAVAALNDCATYVLSPAGHRLFTLPAPCICSEHPDGWVAVTDGQVSLVGRGGQVVWSRPVNTERDWAGCQAAVDSRGRVYVPCTGGAACFDAQGDSVFVTDCGEEQPANVALSEGVLFFVCGGRLFAVG
jgi:outer membrane protein assembly factor BamB